ncbi:36345_t:CDS:2 [Gigaspora margarita]|uniref:36345_t:CDS:1 n=1 Tax=Gigaspora margarita TaxID=4874 RepID=A0ABN7VQQ1_GIGMA|nr:36345_t:CDS:2 [Gigaspora margarita]
MLTEYGLNYTNNLKAPEAWLRFAKYHPPKYICKHLFIPGYEINSKDHWENFVFRIKNNLTSHKQIAKIIQHAVIKWLYRPGGSFMKQAKDQFYQHTEKKIQA